MAYDRDGSVSFRINASNVITQNAAGVVTWLNDESTVSPIGSADRQTMKDGVIFPQLRDIVGYFFHAQRETFITYGAAGIGAVETSADTTNGLDGTWTSRSNPFTINSSALSPAYRNAITVVSWAGVKAVRFTTLGNSQEDWLIDSIHLYGDISAGSEGDSLQLWDPAVDQRIAAAALDFGDVPRSNVSQKQFRVKNRSATKTANSVVVGLEALTDATPSLGSQHQFSLDGSTWASTVTVTAIAPGAISPIIYVRRSTDPSAALSVWAARVTCVPGSWT